MKVKALNKKLLETYDDDMWVVLSRDEEGNEFSPLADGDKWLYVPESKDFGEIYDPADNEDLKRAQEDAQASQTKVYKAVVLWALIESP